MTEKDLTFGCYLNQLLTTRHITVKYFTELTQMKSRNSIHRLLKDQCNNDTIERFYKLIIDNDLLKLSEAEKLQLEESKEISYHGKYKYMARKNILSLFTNTASHSSNTNITLIENTGNKVYRLDEYLSTYKHYNNVDIILFDIQSAELSDALINLVNTTTNTAINIQQLVTLNNNFYTNAHIFTTMFRLFNYQSYNAFFSNPSADTQPIRQLPLNNMMVVNKTKGFQTHTDIIYKDENDHFLQTSVSSNDSVFTFYQTLFYQKRNTRKEIRKSYNHHSDTARLNELFTFLLNTEAKTELTYCLMPNLCYQMMDVKIFMTLLEEADYFGLDSQHPAIKRLIIIMHARYFQFYSGEGKKICFATQKGLDDLINNKVLTDHHQAFRPFTENEILTILSDLHHQMTTNPNFMLLILDDDFILSNLEFIYYKDQCLYIYDSISGYGDDFDNFVLEDNVLSEIFDDFFKNELLPKHVHTEKESIDYIMNLIETIQPDQN